MSARAVAPSPARRPASATGAGSRPVPQARNLSPEELAIVAARLAAVRQHLAELQQRLNGLETAVETALRNAACPGTAQRAAGELEAG